MTIQINITNETSARELAAIAALIDVLRGEEVMKVTSRTAIEIPAPAATAAPPPPASESLIEAEAARAAAAPPPPAQTAQPAAAGTTETDAEGLPWDARIHSTPATKNATDGRWRARRGLDEATKATVTAELRAVGHAAAGGAAAAAAGGADPLPTTATASDAATAFGAGGAGTASEAPPPPAVTAAPPPPSEPVATADPNAISYPQIVTMANDKSMTYDALNEVSVSLGLQKFAELAKRPDLFPMFVSAIQAWTPPAA